MTRPKKRCIRYMDRDWSLTELSNEFGINPRTISSRLQRGWDLVDVLNTMPIHPSVSGRMGRRRSGL